MEFPYVWRWTEKTRPALGDRKGQRCRVLARGKKNSVMVEFEPDGLRGSFANKDFRALDGRRSRMQTFVQPAPWRPSCPNRATLLTSPTRSRPSSKRCSAAPKDAVDRPSSPPGRSPTPSSIS
jgi:hypothetical protein